MHPTRIRPPNPGLSIVVLVFLGTIAVAMVAGPTGVMALPAIFGAVAFLLLHVGR